MAFKVDRSRSIIGAMILGRRVTAMDVAWLRREAVTVQKWSTTPRRHLLRPKGLVIRLVL